MVLLNTERLVLRGLEMRDASSLFALYSDAEVMRYWSHEPWTRLVQAQAAIREAQDDYTQRRSLHLAIAKREGRALLGSCALYAFAEAPGQHTATLGYLLARSHWGRGYAAEALHALLSHGFAALGLQQIHAEVAPDNAASLQLLARLGFRSRGILQNHWKVAGRLSDVEAFLLRRGELSVRGKRCA